MWKAASKKQQITYKGIAIRLTADLSAEILQSRKEWQDILKVIKGEKPQNQITLSSKDLIQIEKIKSLQISKY